MTEDPFPHSQRIQCQLSLWQTFVPSQGLHGRPSPWSSDTFSQVRPNQIPIEGLADAVATLDSVIDSRILFPVKRILDPSLSQSLIKCIIRDSWRNRMVLPPTESLIDCLLSQVRKPLSLSANVGHESEENLHSGLHVEEAMLQWSGNPLPNVCWFEMAGNGLTILNQLKWRRQRTAWSLMGIRAALAPLLKLGRISAAQIFCTSLWWRSRDPASSAAADSTLAVGSWPVA